MQNQRLAIAGMIFPEYRRSVLFFRRGLFFSLPLVFRFRLFQAVLTKSHFFTFVHIY
jgi:hypothetical protein